MNTIDESQRLKEWVLSHYETIRLLPLHTLYERYVRDTLSQLKFQDWMALYNSIIIQYTISPNSLYVLKGVTKM